MAKILLSCLALELSQAFVFLRSPNVRSRRISSTYVDYSLSSSAPPRIPEPTVADPLAAEKADLLASFGGSSSVSKRVMVNEILIKLEAANPTMAPATSPLVNGGKAT
jgi:hypothetical protein